jgi:hypothetical protein
VSPMPAIAVTVVVDIVVIIALSYARFKDTNI